MRDLPEAETPDDEFPMLTAGVRVVVREGRDTERVL